MKAARTICSSAIWIIDDDETALLLAQEVLSEERFDIRTFSDAPSALAAADEGLPDLVIVDVIMPVMDGFEFCSQFRKRPNGNGVPILITTSLDDIASIERACDAGATGFATKPLNWAIEVHRLRYMLRAAQMSKELQQQVTAKESAYAQLAAVQDELIETSRLAGMAEVATDVVHDVGNVLNSINVSTTILQDNLRQSKVLTMVKVGNLLEQHKDDLSAFLTRDPKGKQVPDFLIQLAQHLYTEHQILQKEYKDLARNIEHIKAIVTMQQNYAKVRESWEKIPAASLLEDALAIGLTASPNAAIKLTRLYADVPHVTTDKHRVLQILVNLVRNAQQALAESTNPDKQLSVSVSLDGGNGVKLAVADNGIGISAEHLPRIFSHGFTAREGGHGFGLHSAATLAKAIGGELRAQSDGLGRGATFILELPITTDHPSEPKDLRKN